MSSREQISKLEAILARVKQRAEMPRPVAAAAPVHAPPPVVPHVVAAHPPVEIKVTETIPPNSDARAAIELESRTRVVETTVELDEADLEPASAPPPAVEIEIGEPDEQPPSSRRPKPMEAIAEAQKDEPPPPPPPESGKLVAAVPSFDDDFTGVREASSLLPPLEKDAPSIEVQHVEPPKKPLPVHEMEADLAPAPAESESRRISDVAPAAAVAVGPIEPEITNASLPKAAAVQVQGAVQAFKPQTFGELVDATLGL